MKDHGYQRRKIQLDGGVKSKLKALNEICFLTVCFVAKVTNCFQANLLKHIQVSYTENLDQTIVLKVS